MNLVPGKSRMRWLPLAALFALFLGAALPADALHRTQPRHHKTAHLHRTFRHRLRWNPLFRPSHDSLLRQNDEINRLELPRIVDDAQLEELKASHALVPIESSETLRVQPSLEASRRYCRPWTRDFVQDLSEAYYQRFHEQIQVNSAVRTVTVQKKLRRHNRNAAPAEGETASSHLAGITVDLQRRGLSKDQIRFIEHYLYYFHALGIVEPEEERRHWCFHVMVSDRYSEWRQTQTFFPTHPPVEEVPSSVIASTN
jgi:Family of unknown function (DUF5715)